MKQSDWIFVDDQAALDYLNDKFKWEDGMEVVEFSGRPPGFNEPHYPADIARGGGDWTVSLRAKVLEDGLPGVEFVDLLFIACDRFDSHYLAYPHFCGRLDKLKRVYIESPNLDMRSCRLIYRLTYAEHDNAS